MIKDFENGRSYKCYNRKRDNNTKFSSLHNEKTKIFNDYINIISNNFVSTIIPKIKVYG